MNTNKREDSLDILKGISCLVMVIAHQPYFFSQFPNVTLGLINHLAGLIPPPIFFAISGITATFQIAKYSLGSLTRYFLALFLIGITWNIGLHGDISSYYWPELFQLLALGALFVCVIERNGAASQSVLFLLGAGALLVKPIAKIFWPEFDGWHFLFADTHYVTLENYAPPHNVYHGDTRILPGFPLFPWIGYFILGPWCYRLGKRWKLIATVVSLGLACASVALGSSPIEKWDTSIAYIFSCCTVICGSLWLYSDYGQAHSAAADQLRNIGINAFLFFFVHPLGIMVGVVTFGFSDYFGFPNAYAAWTVSMIVALLAFNSFRRLKPSKRFESRYAWFAMIGATIAIPFLPSLIAHPIMPGITRIAAFAIAITAAINFPLLAKISKVKKTAAQLQSTVVGYLPKKI